MDKIDPTWEHSLRTRPEAEVDVIVRTTSPPPDDPATWEERGLHLRTTFTLVPGVAVTGPAREVLKLLDEPWVIRIEPDREVRAW